METNKLQNLIGKYNANKAEQAKNEHNAYVARMAKYKEELNSWNKKVCEWHNNVILLMGNGFKLYTKDDWRFNSIPYKERERINASIIGTDTIYHEFGVYLGNGDLGIAQGGACGDWHIHTDGNGWWLQKGSQTAELREEDYEELLKKYGDENLNKLERFEKKMENLYAYLEKAAA